MTTKTISKYIFRAYDIRGIYGKDIDPEIFYKIGLSAGKYVKEELKGNNMAVGNDIRLSSYPLVNAFMAGVSASGINVFYTGTTSFGETLFSGWNRKKNLIAFVTASHLPAEWNGLKFYYGDGVGLPEEELQKIRDYTIENNLEIVDFKKTGRINPPTPSDKYSDYLKEKFFLKKKVKVAVDCGGGAMTLSAPRVLKKLGVEVVPVFCKPNPAFSDRPSDPKPENLTVLADTVKNKKCDFGVAFDGDGDRSVIVDNQGNILSSDETGVIIGKHGFKGKTGTVIANVECSKILNEQLSPLGFNIKRIQVGHTFLTLHAKKEKALLGVESSGHIILPDYFLFDDALVVPLKIAEILSTTDEELSTLKSKIPSYPVKKLEIKCSDQQKFDVIKKLKEDLSEKYNDVNTLDGIRVDLKDSWVLIRASNTSPIIRVTVEADNKEKVEEIAKKFKQITEEKIKQMK